MALKAIPLVALSAILLSGCTSTCGSKAETPAAEAPPAAPVNDATAQATTPAPEATAAAPTTTAPAAPAAPGAEPAAPGAEPAAPATK